MTTEQMRELDAWIERNLGIKHAPYDPAAAMQALEKCALHKPNGVYGIDVTIQNRGGRWNVSEWATQGIEVEADTLPTAICLFARELFKEANQ